MRGSFLAAILAAAVLPAPTPAEEEIVLEGPVSLGVCGMWPLTGVPILVTESRTYAIINANGDNKDDLSDTIYAVRAFMYTCSRVRIRGVPDVLDCSDGIEGGAMEGIRVEEITVIDRPACGDVDDSGGVDLTDGIRILQDLFQKDDRFLCDGTSDVNGDGKVDIADAIHLFWYLFTGGRELMCP
jgi:hypothetical protein